MRISVITVCRNSASTIGRTLESFFRQEHADKELVVIDGASTDETTSIVASFASENLTLISERDSGLYDAMNKGLRTFRGAAVGFLNSDDRFHDPWALSAVSAALEAADIVFGDLDVVNDQDRGGVVRRWRSSPWRKGAFRNGWMPAHPTFYCRRRVVDRVGPFDLRYKVAADYDYMLRAMEGCDFAVGRTSGVLVDMAAGGLSSVGVWGRVHHNLEALDSRRRWLGSGPLDYALFAKPLRKVGQYARI